MWKGIRVIMKISCQDRQAKVEVIPTASSLIIKNMGDYERDRKKQKLENRAGNITFQQVLSIAKFLQKEGKSDSREFKGTVSQVLGTCLTLGCTVDGESSKDVTIKVQSGEVKCE